MVIEKHRVLASDRESPASERILVALLTTSHARGFDPNRTEDHAP